MTDTTNTGNAVTKVIENAQTATGGAFVFGVIAMVALCLLIWRMNKDSPFAPHAFELFGLCIIVPLLGLLVMAEAIEANSATGFFGTIIGYIFGAGTQRKAVAKPPAEPATPAP